MVLQAKDTANCWWDSSKSRYWWTAVEISQMPWRISLHKSIHFCKVRTSSNSSITKAVILVQHCKWIAVKIYQASGPGISGNLEKSGNFVALEKCPRKVSELRKIWKSQGILTQNWKKSGNFTCVKWISLFKFFQNSFKWWTRFSHTCSWISI